MTTAPKSQRLGDWLDYLETLSPVEIVLGLDRAGEVLARMDVRLPDRVMTVAGTNGKGSTAAVLAGLLGADGARIGVYASPHVRIYNERIRLGDRLATDQEIVAAFERVDGVRGDTPLTYFEFGTLAALACFESAGVDAAVLEVGLGGRLDAVNVVDADGAIITNVALDHCDWLGPDRESIAREKAGVMRRGRPVIYGEADVPDAIIEAAERRGAELRIAGRDFLARDSAAGRWTFAGRAWRIDSIAEPAMPGRFQRDNAAAALALLEALDRVAVPDAAAVNRVLAGLSLPGRMQRLSLAADWLLDVAHNPAAARALATVLAADADSRRRVALVGLLADKDAGGVIDALAPHIDEWVVVTPEAGRALPAAELAAVVAARSPARVTIAGTIGEAVDLAGRRAGTDGMVVATGSFYLVGPVLAILSAVDRHVAHL